MATNQQPGSIWIRSSVADGCYKEATEVYVTVEPNDAMRGVFPLIEGINAHAENFGGCRGENWQEVLAHAHVEAGYICVRGPVKELFDERGRPTSLLLHEYAHLQVQGGHTEDFWVTTKQLHSEFGVMHRRREQALGSIFGSVCLTGLGLSLWLVFGWGWIGHWSALRVDCHRASGNELVSH